MKSIIKKIIIISSILLFVQWSKAAEEKKEVQKFYSSSTSFSFLLTSGNMKEFTLGFDTEQNMKFKKNQIQFKGSIIYSESEGSKDAEFYFNQVEYRYTPKSKAYILGFGRLERNVLSGYNYRFVFSAGAGYFWIKSEKLVLSSEAAFGWSKENNIDKITDLDFSVSFASFLISSMISLTVSANAELIHQGIFFINLENAKDYRISTLSSFSINISKILSHKISYRIKHSHSPVPGFKSTDQYILSSLVVSF